MRIAVVALVSSLNALAAASAAAIDLQPIGTLKTGGLRSEDPRIAEINAFDAAAARIYVVNPQAGRLDVIDAGVPADPQPAGSVDLVSDCVAALGGACPVAAGSEPNSVAIRGRVMAVAVANATRTSNGHAVLYALRGVQPPRFLTAVAVGALPDMITFSEDGRYVLTANEGEPNADYSIDPPGSVSIVDLFRLGSRKAVRTAGFERFDHPAQRRKLERRGVRIFGPGATVSQDLEPEYIAVKGDKAYVTLQENNALAIVSIAAATVETIVGLGLKDHSVAGNELDPSDQGGPNLATWPVHGLFQPDAIDAFTVGGRTYLALANEGDAREYDAYEEALRLGDAAYVLDPTAFPDAATLKGNAALGRLNVSTASGDTDGDGDFDRIDVFGGRSVSIRDRNGRLVWDSGALFEELVKDNDIVSHPNGGLTLFNTTNSSNARDNRSDDKGIEPESVVVGWVRGRPYAFVGLERDSGIVVLDLSEPSAPTIAAYVTNRKFPQSAPGVFGSCSTNDCGDLGPEGLTFVPKHDSPTGRALLLVSNEVSSTTTIWEVQ